MSKTNDIARAQRALKDVIGQGLPPRHPTRVALQARLDRLQGPAEAPSGAIQDPTINDRIARIERWGRDLFAKGLHPMGSYRLGSLEDQAARRGYFAARSEYHGYAAA